MQPDFLELIQTRMAAAYNEQIWALALVGSMCGFAVTQVDRLIAAISYKKIRSGIWAVTVLCVLFILLRHGVYMYYSSIIDQEYTALKALSPIMTISRWVVLCSGVVLYSCIALGMCIATVLTCKKADQLKKNPER